MIALAVLIGFTLPTLNGWLLLSLLQGKERVLFSMEQIVMGFIVGMPMMMWLVFLTHWATALPLDLVLFLGIQLLFLLIVGSVWMVRRTILGPVPRPPSSPPLSRSATWIFSILGVWIAARTLIIAITFLVLTPTFLDDALDNWNLRAKVMFADRAFTLVMPAEDPATSVQGISSYPPTVHLSKTWLALLAGEWNEGLINSIHVVWYLSALALLFFVLRRRTTLFWSLLGTYGLGSIPLYLMHGTNPYADVFMSVAVFAAASQLFLGVDAQKSGVRAAHLRIGALAAALLPFIKNEGMLLYLPPLLLILLLSLLFLFFAKRMTPRKGRNILLWYAGCIIVFVLPWLLFKWTHGMSFGNAKPVGSLGFGWQKDVLLAVFINTFFEGNWLLLFPLFFSLLLWQWRMAFRSLLPLTAFFLILYLGQGVLYLFTGLSVEAVRQTGYARGLIQLIPVILLLTTLLLAQCFSQKQKPSEDIAKLEN